MFLHPRLCTSCPVILEVLVLLAIFYSCYNRTWNLSLVRIKMVSNRIIFMLAVCTINAHPADKHRAQGVIHHEQIQVTTGTLSGGVSNQKISEDLKCRASVKAKYSWARWVIVGGITLILALIAFSFRFCIPSEALKPVIVFWALVILAWVIMAFVGNQLIFDAFHRLFSGMICEST